MIRMPQMYHISRAARLAAAAALVALLTAGALACGAPGESAAAIEELQTKLRQVEEQNTDTIIKLEVFEARVSQLEEQNGHLSGRITQLEQDKEQLVNLVQGLAALAPGGAELLSGATSLLSAVGAAVSADPVTRETATEAQREMVRQYVECGLKSGGTPDAMIGAIAGPAEDAAWVQIESGEMSIAEVEAGLTVVCAGQ